VQLESVCSIPVQDFLVTRVAFTLDGRYVFYLAAANEDDHLPRTRGLARVWDLSTGAVLRETAPPRPVEAGCFLDSSDGLVFLCNTPSAAGSSRLSGCRLPSGDPAPALDLPGWSIREMAAHGGAVALFGREQVAEICEIEGTALALYPFPAGTYSYPQGASGPLRSIASSGGFSSLSPRGQMLALEAIDARAREHHLSLVALDTKAEARLALAPDKLAAFAFSHDGAQFACLNQDSDSTGSQPSARAVATSC
jgi:hypothetical protein